MRIVIQKFGGTSVSTEARRERLAQRVIQTIDQGGTPVVVVSAMGRKGEPYATDTLLALVRAVNMDLSPREKDLLLSCGEIISAVVVTALLQAKGVRARALTGAQAGILTDDTFGQAHCLNVDPSPIQALLEQGIVPVVAGFQGINAQGDVTTLGRGGSDTTAALLGVALKAQIVEIYTDVDGLMTADPKLVPEAHVLPMVNYHEVYQMADHGANVIHPKAVEVAMQGSVPIQILNAMSDAPGTRICYLAEDGAQYPDVIANIAVMKGRTQVRVSTDMERTVHDVLTALAQETVSIDLINIFPTEAYFTVDAGDSAKVSSLLDEMGVEHTALEDCAKVSAIGQRMRGVPGVMSRIINALNQRGVEVLQTADSHMTISCLVRGEQAAEAVRGLHEEFGLTQM